MSKQNKSKNVTKHGSDYVVRHEDEKDQTTMADKEQSERKAERQDQLSQGGF